MRTFLGAAALVVVVVGGFWLVLSRLVGTSSADNAKSAYSKSVRCVRDDPTLALDRTDAAKVARPGERVIGVRWEQSRAVVLFDETSRAARATVARIADRLQNSGELVTDIDLELRRRGYAVMDYVSGPPSRAARAALGRCIYVVRPNRIARFFGLNITHTARPFLGEIDREEPVVKPLTDAQVEAAFAAEGLKLVGRADFIKLADGSPRIGSITLAVVSGFPVYVGFSSDIPVNPPAPPPAPLFALHLLHFSNVWVEYRLEPALARRTEAALAILRREAFD